MKDIAAIDIKIIDIMQQFILNENHPITITIILNKTENKPSFDKNLENLHIFLWIIFSYYIY